ETLILLFHVEHLHLFFFFSSHEFFISIGLIFITAVMKNTMNHYSFQFHFKGYSEILSIIFYSFDRNKYISRNKVSDGIIKRNYIRKSLMFKILNINFI